MINMLMIDKTIHHTELSYLEDAIGLVETDEERAELKQAVKERKILPVDNLDTDRDYAGHFFYYLAMNVAADGKTKKTEISSNISPQIKTLNRHTDKPTRAV